MSDDPKKTDQSKAPERAPPAPAQPQTNPEAQQAERDARYRNSRGAQVVLDPDSDASLGARGGAGGTIEENTFVRDQHLVRHSMDPRDPDATHLPGNVVPAGGPEMDQVSDDHEPRFDPTEHGMAPVDQQTDDAAARRRK